VFPYGFDCKVHDCYANHNLAVQVGLTYISWFIKPFEKKSDKLDVENKIETEDFIKIVNTAINTLGYNITL